MRERIDIAMVAGLGNPGSEYDGTRHNAGFAVVDRLLSRFRDAVVENCCQSRVYETRFRGKNLFLQKPETFMNLSGKAVAPFLRRKQLDPQGLLLIYDDMDLEVGRLRIRRGGAAGGHHGVESVIQELGNAGFLRLRVGIGHGGKSGADHVLSGLEGEEKKLFEETLDRAADAVIAILTAGERSAMDRFNAAQKIENQEKEQSETALKKQEVLF